MIGHSATFVGTSTSGLTTVAGIINISLPELSVDDIDVTDFDSEDYFREFEPGLIDGGEVGLELNYKKATYSSLHSAIRTSDTFTITFADSSTLAFDGYLKSIGGEAPDGDKVTVSATFKVSGKPTFTPAA